MTAPEGAAPKQDTSQRMDKGYSERLEKFVFALTDFANAIEAAVISLRQHLKELVEITEKETKATSSDARSSQNRHWERDGGLRSFEGACH